MKLLITFIALTASAQNYKSYDPGTGAYPVARVSFLSSQGIQKDLLHDSSLVVYFPMGHLPGLQQANDNSRSSLVATRTGPFGARGFYQSLTGPEGPYFQASSPNSYTISPTPTLAGTFTVMAWVKPSSPSTSQFPRVIETFYQTGFFLGGNGSGQWLFGVNNNVTTSAGTITTGSWPNNPWVFLCGVYNGATATLYVNGTAVAGPTTITSPGTKSLAMAIGYCSSAGSAGCAGSSGAWDGQIDSVRVYSGRALSSGEIAAIYNAENH